jgi:serine/threonine protein kinase
MGGAVAKEYEVGKEQVGSGGLNQFWRLYEGVHKITKERVTIHICLKDSLPKPLRKDWFLARVKNDATMLARLRFPRVLRVLHPFDKFSTSDEFVLVTEPVVCSVANAALRDFANCKEPIAAAVKNVRMNDLDVRNGLRQIGEALEFLHGNRLYHRCVTPATMYVMPNGDFKLGGFYFATATAAVGERVKPDFDMATAPDMLPGMPPLQYAAPQFADKAREHDGSADVRFAPHRMPHTAPPRMTSVLLCCTALPCPGLCTGTLCTDVYAGPIGVSHISRTE